MEAEQPNGASPADDELLCWLSSPTLEEFRTKVNEALLALASASTDPDSKPHLKIYKYPQFLINVAIRHMLNNNVTDFIDEFRMYSLEDYNLIKTIANEIHESLVETIFDNSYTCTYVELFGDDLVAVRIKL